MSNKTLIWILLAISIGTHFAFFGHPNQTVFDEVHFGKFISGYYTHEYYFDIHPPLGKLMIAGFAKIFNFKPEFSFAQIGEEFPDNKYIVLRFLPSLAGALLPIVIFLLALQLKFSSKIAFITGFLIAIENALIVQTHFILMDGFLLLFGFLALLFYFRRKFVWMAIFGALAISIKWTGLTFLALPFLIEIFQLSKQKQLKQSLNLPTYFLIIPLLIYFSVFVIHFSLLTKPGSGDAFMSSDFHNENVVKKFIELNVQMYQSNQRLTATHPYSSPWYSWPVMARPIYYWNNINTTSNNTERIYLLGNPFIWYLSTVALLYSILSFLLSKSARNKILTILLGGYFLNLLPFIGIKRVMFLYHYFTAYIFAVLMLAYWINKIDFQNKKKEFVVLASLIVVSILFFLYFSPLSYGLNISQPNFMNHMWSTSWE
jgi:dolichyl-phosphate-mannose--protein O-mannosyl transferase